MFIEAAYHLISASGSPDWVDSTDYRENRSRWLDKAKKLGVDELDFAKYSYRTMPR